MKTIIILLVLLVFSASCQRNTPPLIANLEVLTETIVGGSVVDISATMHDDQGDILHCQWYANGGEFISSTDSESVQWKAPLVAVNTDFILTLMVSDDELSVSEEVVVTVEGGRFLDSRDDHIYQFVQIGEQTWMAENLAYLPQVDASSVGSNVGIYYYVFLYEGSSVPVARQTESYSSYGVLYNWNAAMTACPTGWHLPEDMEWKELELFLE